jgi:hypothetical protein
MKKVYIVRKYILANSVGEALRKEKKHKPDDAYVEEKSINNFIEKLQKEEPAQMGFKQKKK